MVILKKAQLTASLCTLDCKCTLNPIKKMGQLLYEPFHFFLSNIHEEYLNSLKA